MTHTSEFLSQMARLDDGARAYAMTNYLAQHGDSAMTESLRLVVDHAERLVTDPSSNVWEGVPTAIAEAFTSGNSEHLDVVIGVWNSWVDVVNAARANGGVVVAASNTSAASSGSAGGSGSGAVTAAGPSRCPSCGVPSVGVCNRCENQSILDDHVEYDRRLYEIDQDRIEHDRLRDDRTAYDTSPSYDSGYDAGSSSSYDDD